MSVEVEALYKHARISAQKARLIGDLIRGESAESALDILTFSPKKGAKFFKEVLTSAIANAEHNESLDIDELKVSTVYVNEGTTMKRFRARAKGRGARILKRTCHITVKVAEGE